jgi:hypothetical protein
MAEQGKRVPAPRKPPRPASSWLPVDWDLHHASAIQALARGDANEDQQRLALRWILVDACQVDEPSYCPGGEEGRRDTDHHEGRRWVGIQIRKLMNVAVSKLR